MRVDTIIVGQGLSGSWLSYWLNKAGAEFLVIDDGHKKSATKVASGIINPVTGRRMVKTWLADELLPFAEYAYGEMATYVGQSLINKTELVDFFSSPDRRISFEKRAQDFENFLEWPEDENKWNHFFAHPFGFGIVSPVYQVNLQAMLQSWRNYLETKSRLHNESFDSSQVHVSGSAVQYKDIQAAQVIFCDGTGVMSQEYFRLLPFAFNKGEALLVDIPDLPHDRLFKKTQVITPWQGGLFWVGSNYDREYLHEEPTDAFRIMTETWLKGFLKLPFQIVDHIAAIRPTTVERRPFAGMHPVYNNVGILNGMGTKGVALAPWLAKQLCDHLTHGEKITPEADVKQYARILQRTGTSH